MTNEERALNQPEDAAAANAVAPTDALGAPAPDPSTPDLANDPATTDDVAADSPVADSDATVADENATLAEDATSAAETPDAPAPAAPSDEAPVADETPAEPVAEMPVSGDDAVSETEPTGEIDPQDDLPVADAPAEEAPSIADETGGPDIAADTETADEPLAELPTADTDQPDVAAAQYDAPVVAEEAEAAPQADYSQFSKEEFVTLLQEQYDFLKGEGVGTTDYKRADDLLKVTKPLFDKLRRADRQTALNAYVAESGSEEGFQFTPDETSAQYEALYKQIKSDKNTFFQNLDKAKDDNFSAKTELLRRLRELVESDEANAGDDKASWNEFKKIQDEWKAAGNMNSPHNATLWATYHALVDRYYSNRNIYFELKELDRKKNAGLKAEVIEKVEALAQRLEDQPVKKQTIDEANALFEEYKHIGPAPKAEQEVLWQRMKTALDVLYDKRRGQTEEYRRDAAQLYEEKSKLYEQLVPYSTFTSTSINDWNDKTKEVAAIQEQWNGLKGLMPREEGKELSKKFWAALKGFFSSKGEFFRQLEGKREQNLQQKVQLCEEVERLLAAGDTSAEATQRVIELQKQWRTVGQVPEKQKNSIFERFKAACDAFFNQKRGRSQDTDREFADNLAKKNDLIARIEAAATTNADLAQLNAFKTEWASIGFVPRNAMRDVQDRYIAAVNALVKANGTLSPREREQALQDAEAGLGRGPRAERSGPREGAPRGGGGPREGARSDGAPRGPRNDRPGGGRPEGGRPRGGRNDRYERDGGYRENRYEGGSDYRRQEDSRFGDLRRKISTLENDIATYRNNIEFFARSKNADKLRAEIDAKIADAQGQLDQLRQQLRDAQDAAN